MTTTAVRSEPTTPDPTPGAGDGGTEGLLDRWSDPTTILIAAGVLALVSLIPSAIKAPLTFPLALLLPGHALLAALERPDRGLGTGGRLALRVILSITAILLMILVVGSLFGVSTATIVGSTWAFTSIAALVSWDREVPTAEATASARWTQSGVLLVLTAIISVVVVVGALILLPEPRPTPYSALAVAGTTKSSGSPIRVRSGRTATVEVEVQNGTTRTMNYRVIPAIDGGAAWEAPKVNLAPGERWTGTVKGKIPKDACLSRLTIALAAEGKDSGVAPLVLYVRNEATDACG